MEYRTCDGVQIFVLPENAKCGYTGKHPDDCEECPIGGYTEDRGVCIPDICPLYFEG